MNARRDANHVTRYTSRGVAFEWHEIPSIVPGCRAWQKDIPDGHLSVFAGREPGGWHLSISHRRNRKGSPPGRIPTWYEIKDARYRFVPGDVTMAMLLPPTAEFVNVHPTTMHLWQVADQEHA